MLPFLTCVSYVGTMKNRLTIFYLLPFCLPYLVILYFPHFWSSGYALLLQGSHFGFVIGPFSRKGQFLWKLVPLATMWFIWGSLTGNFFRVRIAPKLP